MVLGMFNPNFATTAPSETVLEVTYRASVQIKALVITTKTSRSVMNNFFLFVRFFSIFSSSFVKIVLFCKLVTAKNALLVAPWNRERHFPSLAGNEWCLTWKAAAFFPVRTFSIARKKIAKHTLNSILGVYGIWRRRNAYQFLSEKIGVKLSRCTYICIVLNVTLGQPDPWFLDAQKRWLHMQCIKWWQPIAN